MAIKSASSTAVAKRVNRRFFLDIPGNDIGGIAMSRFAIIVEFDLLEGSFDLFHQEAMKNAGASKNEEPGCQVFDVLIPNREKNRIVLYDVYDSEAAFQEHLMTRHFKDFSNRVSGLVRDRKLNKFGVSNTT